MAEPFQILGHDSGVFFYLCSGSGQIVELKADQHVEGRLIALAPRQWWEREYRTKQGPDWRAAQNAMIQKSYEVGIYNPDRVRGRGAWWDGDHAVLHLGDRLIVGNKEVPLSSPGEFIYEAAIPFRINHKNPLDAKSARKLIDICELIAWEKPISARYLAGWIALAPICGALVWRPHAWITGSSGAGKSWAFNNIVMRLIGSISQAAQHSTTEAGLRQTLRHDAKPVIFDEAEAKDQRAQLRIDNVLELARSASTEGSPAIIKGSPDGNASTWRIRSMFLFSSVNYGVRSTPDENRITAMTMLADGNKERFAALSKMVADTLTDDYVDCFLARSIKMIPVIRANARIFAAASAPVLGNQRAGDQVGALLAGAYSLHSDGLITAKEAAAYIAKQDWVDQKAMAGDTDETKCLSRIVQTLVKVQTKSGTFDMSIARLIEIARTDPSDGMPRVVGAADAADALGMRGIRADKDGLVISISHNELARMLRDTEWSISWGRTLGRLPGAKLSNGSERFQSIRSRAVKIPYQDEDAPQKPAAPVFKTAEEEELELIETPY